MGFIIYVDVDCRSRYSRSAKADVVWCDQAYRLDSKAIALILFIKPELHDYDFKLCTENLIFVENIQEVYSEKITTSNRSFKHKLTWNLAQVLSYKCYLFIHIIKANCMKNSCIYPSNQVSNISPNKIATTKLYH